MRNRTGAALIALAMLAHPAPASAVEITGEARVLDGDTLDIGPVRIRLHGIDAPERSQTCATARGTWTCGIAASDRILALTKAGPTTCIPIERDAFGRIVADCTADGVNLGATLVAEGLAWAFLRYSDTYAEIEAGARARGEGIWQAATQTPWDYRETSWTEASGTAPEGCPIKGNISRSGERIYHTPWSRDYKRTQINETYGERWFCDEAEAITAGWRAPMGR